MATMKNRTTYTIAEAIDKILLGGNINQFTFKYQKQDEESGTVSDVTILSGESFIDLISNYADFSYFATLRVLNYRLEEDSPEISLFKKWEKFTQRKRSIYSRMLEAIQMEYNPLENYNGVEHSKTTYNDLTTEKQGSEINTQSGTDTVTPSGKKEVSLTKEGKEFNQLDYNGTEKVITDGDPMTNHNTKKAAPEDNNTFYPTEYDEQYVDTAHTVTETDFENRNNKNTTSFENYKETTTEEYKDDYHTDTLYGKTDTLTYTGRKDVQSGSFEFDLSKSGNLGMTTSDQMLENHERVRRMLDLEQYIVYDFVAEYANMLL